jgi:hypothetical protein
MNQRPSASSRQVFFQPEFAFTGYHSRQTQRASVRTLGASKRQESIRKLVANAPNGLTRQEIADALEVPVNHITKPVLDLVVAGDLVETAETRLTRWGKRAVVLVCSHVSTVPGF